MVMEHVRGCLIWASSLMFAERINDMWFEQSSSGDKLNP